MELKSRIMGNREAREILSSPSRAINKVAFCSWEKHRSLYSPSVHCVNILEKIIQNKRTVPNSQDMWKYERQLWGRGWNFLQLALSENIVPFPLFAIPSFSRDNSLLPLWSTNFCIYCKYVMCNMCKGGIYLLFRCYIVRSLIASVMAYLSFTLLPLLLTFYCLKECLN